MGADPPVRREQDADVNKSEKIAQSEADPGYRRELPRYWNEKENRDVRSLPRHQFDGGAADRPNRCDAPAIDRRRDKPKHPLADRSAQVAEREVGPRRQREADHQRGIYFRTRFGSDAKHALNDEACRKEHRKQDGTINKKSTYAPPRGGGALLREVAWSAARKRRATVLRRRVLPVPPPPP